MKEKLKRFFNILADKMEDPKTKRTFRISYQVIWNLVLLFIVLAVIGTAFAGGVGAGYFASLIKDEPVRSKEELSENIYNYEETSKAYFAGDIYLGDLRTDLIREEIPLSDMSDYLKDAIIATEDEYFYKHDGVVPKAIIRALLQEVTNSSVQSGGSTLTQQLIKQQVLTNEVSFERKAKEILLAMRVEKFFEKEDILEAYLNVSPFGRNSDGDNIAGVQAAAKGVFGVDAKDLNLAQAAYIAGLPQSPSAYTPFSNTGTKKENLEPGLTRQKTVLNRMLSAKMITKTEYDEALDYDIIGNLAKPTKGDAFDQYPALTAEIEQRAKPLLAKHLALKDGITEEEYSKSDSIRSEYENIANSALRNNGYRIHTTIVKDIWTNWDKAKDEFNNYGPDRPQLVKKGTPEEETVMEKVEAGAMLIENNTGRILSFLAGRDYDREYNHATSPRPTGSTIKPLLVFAPGIELGKLAPGSLALNVPISIPMGGGQGPYTPGNYGGSYSGLTSARNALKKSQNIPAVLFYMNMLNQNPLDYLKKMGISTIRDEEYGLPAISIAGPGLGISVEENTNAFATLANNGKFTDAYMIEKIETKDGQVIYQHEAKEEKVFSPQTAYMTIDMMRDVLTSGTATTARNHLNFSSDFAGKTGTSQDYHDAWFIASNPNITLGVWNGYDTPKSLDSNMYSKRNQQLWAKLMNEAYAAQPELIGTKKRFASPGGMKTFSYCSALNLPTDLCAKAGITADLFPANFSLSLPDKATAAGKIVVLGDERYAALESTPDEFTETGQLLSKEFLKMIGGKYVKSSDLAKYVGMSGGSGTGSLQENGKKPQAMSIALKDNYITWGKHPEKDVIGYRVYKDNQKVASIKADQNLRYSAKPGRYIVKAVDIAGKESPASNVIVIEKKQAVNEDRTEKKDSDKDPKKEVAPTTEPDPNPTPEPPPTENEENQSEPQAEQQTETLETPETSDTDTE
ncbi:MAG: transglycosylase domain-containing protein [Bacillus sp. (in: firmicutes)]